MAAKAYSVTNLGYMGVDIVLDRDRGPLLLELNARPGISIQIANRMGMRPALEAAKHHGKSPMDAQAMITVAKAIHTDAKRAA